MLHRRAAQSTRTPRRGDKTQPIFRTIFGAMMLVLVAEVLLLVISIQVTDVGGRLNQNAKDMLAMQVRNRVGYMQDLMQDAQDLTNLSDYIDRVTLSMVNTGRLDLDALNTDSEQSSALLAAIAPELVNTLRARSVTGIFVVLNTKDLRLLDVGSGVPGIYLRDLDPDARPSENNADLLIERGSAAVVKALGITTDKSWQPVLRYYGLKGRGFFKEPFLRAYEDNARLSEEYYGRWTTSAYTISGDDRSAIAYSQPLILPDGTVYGVVGVELLTSYLQGKMPYAELQNGKEGAYFLVSTTAEEDAEKFVVSKAVTSSQDSYALAAPASMMRCERRADGCWLNLHKRDYYAVAMPISLYSRNAPFSDEHWMLIGAVNSQTLFAFAQNVRHVLTAVVVGTLVLGILSSLLIARKLARPVELLYHEVVDGQEKKKFPELSHTKIRELDRLADALTSLNSELLNNSTKFLRIMDMASVELGGYELRFDTGSVYVTDNFFSLLGEPQPKDGFLSVRRFEETLSRIQLSRPCATTARGDKLLTIRKGGQTRYVLLRVTKDWNVQVGLAEDVTAATLERLRIEHERDYDILTGLYNRQAFQRVCSELFEHPQQLGTAALLMMDLDNLKHINDTYGHDWGDQYIHRTGLCLAENTPAGTVVARLSGDEFMLLFYGYPGREQIREKVRILSDAMQKSVAVLPGGSELRISISGGMAWYPEDSRDMETLKKYADFALYQVKHSHKGCLKEFSMESYRREAQTAQLRRDFQQLLTEERVYYVFQPIFSAHDGRVMAYEALMRSDMERLRSPATIMKLAREHGALHEIERLTFFKSLETFDHLCSEGLVRRDALLFINSIASIALPQEDNEYMDSRWHELLRQVVIEITEEEAMDREAMEAKHRVPGFSGMFALDDYGSGYSNEGSLLELSPRFIKVDLTIIRGIDTDPDKQQIVQNIVAYAHPRSMQIIAEGVETAEELKKVLELGVDGLQGYFLAKPANIPARIAPAARQIIENSHSLDCG